MTTRVRIDCPENVDGVIDMLAAMQPSIKPKLTSRSRGYVVAELTDEQSDRFRALEFNVVKDQQFDPETDLEPTPSIV